MNPCENGHRQTVRVKRVDEVSSLDELFRHCLPAFGGAYLRRVYTILDRAIGMGCPLTLAIGKESFYRQIELDLSAAYALALAATGGAKRILVAGFDGFADEIGRAHV